jgi:hypothetical protein
MPGHSLATPTQAMSTQTPQRAVTPQSDQDQLGNAAVQDQLAASQKTQGQLTWEGALGEALGSKLYDALSDKLSDEQLESAARKAVGSATRSLDSFLKGKADASEQEAAAAFVTALDGELKRIAANAVSGELGDILREFVDDSPILIASAVVAAAAAYVISNQKIGMVDGKVKLGGGHAIVGGLDLGRTMDIAVQQVRLGYRYSNGNTKAEVIGDYFTEDGSWKVAGRYERQLGEHERVSLSGSHLEQGDMGRTRLDLNYQDEVLGTGAWWQRDREFGGQKDTFGGQISAKKDDWSAYMRGQASTDGAHSAAAGFQQTQDNKSWGVEGYTGRDETGRKDSGVRAVFKWRF